MAIDFPDSPTQGQTFQSGDRLWIYNGYAWDYLLNVVTSELSDHGLLIGLTDDDHSQYLLADGSRTLSGNLTVTGTVDGRDVAADGTKLDGIESGATADQTASEILTAIKTVDGPDSGLDADTLDGNQAADFEPVGTTATHAADNDIHVVAGTATGQVATWNNSTGAWEAQVTDHGALTGLADDDHTQYLLTNGTRAATALDVNGDSTFDGDFAVTVDTAGNVQSFRVGSGSKVIFNVNDWGVGAGLNPGQIDAASLNVSPSDTASLGIKVKGLASQTGNLTQWENSSGTVIAQVDAAGEISSTGLDVTGNIIVSGTVDGRDIATDGAIIDAAVTSSDVDDIVEISQASYNALGSGRPAGRLYLITS